MTSARVPERPRVTIPEVQGKTLRSQIPVLAAKLAEALAYDMEMGRQPFVSDDGVQMLPVSVDVRGPDGLRATLVLALSIKRTS